MAHKVEQELKVLVVQLEHKEIMAHKVEQELKVLVVQLEHKEIMAQQELKELLVTLAELHLIIQCLYQPDLVIQAEMDYY
jgi:hypothetical protein